MTTAGPSQRDTIVISAVNFVSGGPLSVLKDCLLHASAALAQDYEIVALVHRKDMFDLPHVRLIEFPKAKSSWLRRLYHEWFVFHRLSTSLRPFLWLSLHDITPRVDARRQAVYCHNPAPFYALRLRDVALDPRFAMFNAFYGFLYGANIGANDWVIVQQEWIRQEFIRRYGVSRIVVAHAAVPAVPMRGGRRETNAKYVFFFPTLPRVFKNIEVIGEAANRLSRDGRRDFVVWITIDGSENPYARHIRRQFGREESIKFIGLQPRERVYELYADADCLIFPSRLETWGLPISEFQQFDKPILAANLPYAHETLGAYRKVRLFDPSDADQLATAMAEAIDGHLAYSARSFAEPAAPFARNWDELFRFLLQ